MSTQLEDLKRTIRSKANWEQNLYNENILTTYLTEAVAQGISEETFQKAIERLRSEEALQAATRSMESITTSTTNIDTAATSTNNLRTNTCNNTTVNFDMLREQVTAAQGNIRRFMDEPLQEKENGVWVADNVVPPILSELLTTLLGSIKLGPDCEFDPEVHDLIDPSIYPYINGVSYLVNPLPTPGPSINKLCQWLPAQFAVDENGRVEIKSYINNLDRLWYPDLYKTIELVFGIFLPMFEECLKDLTEDLRSRELQVIVKATNFGLQSGGEVYEEQWQVEGLPREHIIASGIYYYSASPFMKAGIIFRRRRGSFDYPFASQDLLWERDDIGDENRDMDRIQERIQRNILLGAAPMTEGRCIVFPNSLQHKLFIGLNESEKSAGVCKVLRFFLVDPSRTIISTKDVLEQQWDVMGPRVMAALDDVVLASIGKGMPPEILLEILPWAKSGLTYKEAQSFLTSQKEERNLHIEGNNSDWDGVFTN